MNRLFIGVIVVVLGVVAGWYILRAMGTKGTLSGQQTSLVEETPAPIVSSAPLTTSGEATIGGTKGGVIERAVVTYTDAGYAPNPITVKKGTTVAFVNESTHGMWTASGVHPTHQLLPGFDALKSYGKGGTYEYTFVKVGRWQYHNHLLPTDGGIVVVTE